MSPFKIVLILLVLCAFASRAAIVPRSLENHNNNNNKNMLDDDDDDDDDDDSKSKEQLPIASIKSRAIAMDRELCKKMSRYHPHFPRCQEYCARLNHWMGMCRRDSCHCYS